MKILKLKPGGKRIRHSFAVAGLAMAAFPAAAQEPEDGVIATCLDRGNTPQVCVCASVLLNARFGPELYDRFGAISLRIAEIEAGDAAQEGEMAALTAEGYQYFVPHGQSIAVCRARYGDGN